VADQGCMTTSTLIKALSYESLLRQIFNGTTGGNYLSYVTSIDNAIGNPSYITVGLVILRYFIDRCK